MGPAVLDIHDTRRPRAVERVRPLRGFELLLAGHGLPAVVVAQVRGPLTALALQQAAFRVQRRYPSLRTRIVLNPSRDHVPCVEFCEARAGDLGFEEIRWEEELSFADKPVWQGVLERELNRVVGPAVEHALRLIWLPGLEPGGHVIVSARSALVDGSSLLRILHDLLEESSKLIADPAGKRTDAYALEPSPPSPSFLEAFPPRLRDRLRARFAASLLREAPTTSSTACPVPDAGTLKAPDRVTTRTSFSAGHASSVGVRQACEAHGATLSATALAAAEFAWMRLRTELGQRVPVQGERLRLELTMDFDCRKDCSAPCSPEVGLLTGRAEVGLEVPADIPFWQLARRLRVRANQQFRRRIPVLFHQALDGKRELGAEFHAFGLDGAAPSGSAQAFSFSNLGPYPYATRLGALELLELYCAPIALPCGPRFSLHLHELSERYHYALAAAQPACAASVGDRFLEGIVGLLESCTDSRIDDLALREHAAGVDLRHP